MNHWPDLNNGSIHRYVQTLQLRTHMAQRVYRCILGGFQQFVSSHSAGQPLSCNTVKAWLANRVAVWPLHLVLHRARLVDRFLDWLVTTGYLAINPLAELRQAFEQHTTTPIIRALLRSDSTAALEALRPPPRFASHLGPTMRDHLLRMKSLGYRYCNCERQFLRFDRFLQMRPGAAMQAPDVLINEWGSLATSAEQKVQRLQAGRSLTKALQRAQSTIIPAPTIDRRLLHQALQQRRRPYIYSIDEVKRVLVTARRFPSPHAPLRPLTLYTVVVLAYCVGLRFGEIVRLTAGDVDLREETIDIRETKFFKYRRLPLQPSVIAALREYLDARSCSGAPDHPDAPLFWHERGRCGYSQGSLALLLIKGLRQAGLKPAAGRVGPRIHDFRHSFVVHRMTAWYREGINPQSRLPYLATYLGHKDIYSTMVYLTMTEELLHQANERFRTIGAEVLLAAQGGKSCN